MLSIGTMDTKTHLLTPQQRILKQTL